jgi:hypothetical protein
MEKKSLESNVWKVESLNLEREGQTNYAQPPRSYYTGRLTFIDSPLPNGMTSISFFSESIYNAETLLLVYAEKHRLAGEVVIKNIRTNEVVHKVQCNFTKFLSHSIQQI